MVVSEPIDSPRIAIGVVDRNPIFRAGLLHCLTAEDAFAVIAQAATLKEMTTAVGALRPVVILVGMDVVEADVLEDLSALRAAAPWARIVVMLAREEPFAVKRVLMVGVQAALPRHTTPQELAGAVRGVVQHSDRIVLSLTQRTLDGLQGHGSSPLTAREQEIVALVARGLRNSQIAHLLVIAEGTVKRHLSNVYAKLDASCRTDAVRKAGELGLIPAAAAEIGPAATSAYGAAG
jgi:DNA-binding NarL/FixJ family response regulator